AGLLEVTVELGALRRKARHGLPRQDVASAFPQIPLLANAGFFCQLFYSSVLEAVDGAGDRPVLTVTARSRDGREIRRVVELAHGPAARAAVADDPAMLL